MSEILSRQQIRLKKKSNKTWIIGIASTIIFIAGVLALILLDSNDIQSYAERYLNEKPSKP